MNNQIQIVFDVNRSLKANPPKYDVNLGIRHVAREAGKLSDLITVTAKGVSLQPREKTIDDKQFNLKHSYTVNGVMYEKEVMVAELRKDGKKELISGFGRLHALQEMGVDTYFYDVVEFTTPFWKTVWKRRFNVSRDHIGQGTPQTEASYLKGLIELKSDEQFKCTGPGGDIAVLEALEIMSDGQLTEAKKRTLLRKFRKNNSKYASTVAMNKVDANAAAKKLGLPTSGYVQDLSSDVYGQSGFVCRNGGKIIGEVMSWAKLYLDYKIPVSIVAYVEHTDLNETKIRDARVSFEKTLERVLEQYIEPIFKEEFHNMFKFEGFLAQICGPDPDQGGRPKERGLVDVDGNIIYEMVDGKKVYPNKEEEALSVAA